MSKIVNSNVTPLLFALISLKIFASPLASRGYIGGHLGSALAKFDVSNPYGHSIYGDTIRVPGFIGGIQAGYNWQLPGASYLFGVEARVSGLDAEASNTCFAYSGEFISSNGIAHPNVSAMLAGRVGFALDKTARSLVYLKAGLAALNSKVRVTNNNVFFGTIPVVQNYASSTQWGGVIGAGIEFAMTAQTSIELEYDFLKLANSTLYAPPSYSVDSDNETAKIIPGAKAHVKQRMHQLMLGLNYYLSPNLFYMNKETERLATMNSPWQFEAGLRYYYSYGRFQKNMPAATQVQSCLISRLVYDSLGAHSGEMVMQLNTPCPLFVKGNIGVGLITSGHLNDEDWGLPKAYFGSPVAYSNTFSDLDKTKLSYATLDFSYEFLAGKDYTFSFLVGYNHIKERYTANDIIQISPQKLVHLSSPQGQAVITETDKWNALRLGFATKVWLNPKFRLDVDAAYLPCVRLNGRDDHWLRGLIFTEMSSGRGVQLDVLASYALTPQLRFGLGGRYWAAWSNGSDKPNGLTLHRVDTFRYERFGAFIQGSYLLNDSSG